MHKITRIALAAFGMVAISGAVQAAKYKEVDVSDGGTITGKVSASSEKDNVRNYTISKDGDVCGTGERVVPMVETKDGALLNAVVYLEKVKAGKKFPSGMSKNTLDQKTCTFAPYLSFMRNSGELEAVNSDSVLHNIHVYEQIGRARRTVLNVSQPEKGNIVTKKIKLRKGSGMKIECDAHDFMHAFVFVARNPYFAQVNDKGEYEIKDVPAGKYTVKVWHGFLGEKKAKVEMAAGGSAKVDFSY